MPIALADYDDIVKFEVVRFGRIRGYDKEDVLQEVRQHVALRCLPKIKLHLNTGRTYVRLSIRRALGNLKREATAAKRCPKDRRGRSISETSIDQHRVQLVSETANPEHLAETRELIRALDALPIGQRALLVRAFVDGVTDRDDKRKIESARKRAEGILTRLLNGVQGGQTMTKSKREIPECHAMGSEPIGYETNLKDAQDCQDCGDKFTCLPDGIRTRLIDADLSIDPEVKAAYRGFVTTESMRARVAQRQALRESGDPIPKNLRFDAPPIPIDKLDAASNDITVTPKLSKGETTMAKKAKKEEEAEEPKAKTKVKAAKPPPPPEPDEDEEEEEEEEQVEEEAEADEVDESKDEESDDEEPEADEPEDDEEEPEDEEEEEPMKKAKKKEKVAKAPKEPKVKAKKAKIKESKVKAAKRKKNENAPANSRGEKGSFRYEGKSKKLSDGRIQLPNGRIIPAPKELTKEQMGITLARLNEVLALPLDLDYGMRLVQERRKGGDMEITLAKNGYHLNLNGETYGSLTAACMAGLGRFVSGPAVFNFEKNGNVAVTGKGVPGGEFRRGKAEAKPAKTKKAKVAAEEAPKPPKAKKFKAKKAKESDEDDE